MRWLMLFIALYAPIGQAEEWKAADYTLLAASLAVQVIDWGQTRSVARETTSASLNGQTPVVSRTYYERNPFIGENPTTGDVDKYFAAQMLATASIAYVLPQSWRRLFLGGMLVFHTSLVYKNHEIGLRVDF